MLKQITAILLILCSDFSFSLYGNVRSIDSNQKIGKCIQLTWNEKDKKRSKKQRSVSEPNSSSFVKHKIEIHPAEVKYIIAKCGDTYPKIAKEFSMGIWQLYKYNDFPGDKDHLAPGDIVYLQPKRKGAKKKKVFIVSVPQSLLNISQNEAIRVQSLLRKNKHILSETELLTKGVKVTLR